MQEKEVSFPIESFSGINRNIDREKLSPANLHSAKNLWEKRLNVLETRGGSEEFATFPPNVSKVLKLKKLYKSNGENVRIAAIRCDRNVNPLIYELNLAFDTTPSSGSFYIQIGDDITGAIEWDVADLGVAIQGELQALDGLSGATASGSYGGGIVMRFLAESLTGEFTIVNNTLDFGGPVGTSMYETSPYLLADLPTGFAISFVNDASGYWNKNRLFALNYISGPDLYVRFIGYGWEQWYRTPASSVSGYAGATDQRLVVTITQEMNENITGYEIYSNTNCGSTVTPVYQAMWVGYKNLIGVASATHDWRNVPLGQSGTVTTGTEVGFTKRSYVGTPFGDETGGNLQCGKTYYVAILPHHIKMQADGTQRCCYRSPNSLRVGDSSVTAVYVPGTGNTGLITIPGIDALSITLLVAIGESPDLLQPYQIFNNVTTSGLSITELPETGNPGVIDIYAEGNNNYTYQFRFADISLYDMLAKISDDGTVAPVFCGRGNKNVNDSNFAGASFACEYYIYNNVAGRQYAANMGKSSKYSLEQNGDMLFLTNGYDVANIPDNPFGSPGYFHRTNTNYFQTDGNVAATVIQDFYERSANVTFTASTDLVNLNSNRLRNGDMVRFTEINTTTGIVVYDGTPATIYFVRDKTNDTFKVSLTLGGAAINLVGDGTGIAVLPQPSATLPIFKYISQFQGSILLSGGYETIDPITLSKNSAAQNTYFSQALNPNAFTIPGYSIYQTISVKDDAEEITGIGIYSNSTGQEGPISQLLTTKKNKLYVLNGLPSSTGGVLDPSVKQVVLSAKIGCVNQDCIINTTMGTVIVDVDDVYVIRGDGEPTPIGREIYPILKKANLSNAQAVFHDKHVKISFYHEDYDPNNLGAGINNVEFWLDVNKLIEQKGVSSWVGPMIGHWNQACIVEDRDDDVGDYRYCCEGNDIDNAPRIYRTDIEPSESATCVGDFGVLMESEISTKDLEITPQDNNWNKLIKRTYWKLKIQNGSQEAADIEEDTYVDGVLVETKSFEAYGDGDTDFSDQPLKLNRLFPSGRQRGRTVRKTLRTSSRIAIAGFQLNYSPEKRRI